MNTYEGANIRRWILILLNIVFFIGVFLPLFSIKSVDVTALSIRQQLRTGYFSFKGDVVAWGLGATVCFLLLILCPVFHLLKLLGLLGEARRNSRGWSLLFSIFELIGVLGLLIICFKICVSLLGSKAGIGLLLLLSTWSYIWLVLTIIAIVLSNHLGYTPPVFRSLSGNSKGDIICEECGRRNPGDANYCLGCGNPLAQEEEEITPWYCPKCGEKNESYSTRCEVCKARKPKNY